MGFVLYLPIKAAIRDIKQNKARLLVIVSIVALSVAFPLAFMSTADSLSRSIDIEMEKFKLAHLDIRFTAAHENVTTTIRDIITQYSGRSPEMLWARPVGYGRMEAPNGKWTEMSIIGVPIDEKPKVNQLLIKKGSYLTDNKSVLVLTTYAQALGIDVGDKINVTAAENRFLELTVVGLVDSVEFGSYKLLEQGALFTTPNNTRYLAKLDELFPNDNRGISSVAIYLWKGVSTEYIHQLAVHILEELEADDTAPNPLLIWETRQISARKVLQQATDLVTEYMAISSMLVILIAGLVIYIIMNRYVSEHRKLIGVYHSYGFSKMEILLSFQVRILIMGIIGTIIGIFGSFILLYAIESSILKEWAVNSLVVQLNTKIGLLMIVGIPLILIVFSFLPAWKAAAMTPYEALRGKIGLVNIQSITLIDKIPSLLIKQVIRSFSRNKMRSLFTLIAIFFALTLSFSLLTSADSTGITLNQTFNKKLKYNTEITFFNPQNDSTLLQYREFATDNNAIEPVFSFYAQMADHIERIIRLVGIWGNSTLHRFDLIRGFSLQDYPNKSAAVAVIPYREAQDLNLTLGSQFTIRWMFGGFKPKNLTFTVIGIDRAMDMPISIFVNLEFLRQHMMDYDARFPTYYSKINYFNVIHLKLSHREKIKEFFKHGTVFNVKTYDDIYNYVKSLVETELIIVYIVAALGFLVTFIVIFNTFYLTILERDREVSILRAFGESKGAFFIQFLLEALVMAFIAYIGAIYPSRFIVRLLVAPIENAFYPIEKYLTLNTAFIIGTFTIIASIFAIYPSFKTVTSYNLANALRKNQ